MGNWFPYLGFRDLDDNAVSQLGLEKGFKWKGFVFEWFNHGFLIFTVAFENN